MLKNKLHKRDLCEYTNIISEYKEFLTEERGVSNIVQQEAEYVSNILKAEVDNINPIYNTYGIFEMSNQYEYNVFDKDIILDVNFIFFIDRGSFLKYGKEYINRRYYYNNKTNTLSLNVIIIENSIVLNTFKTKIAHELKHLYQIIKTNKHQLNQDTYYLIMSNKYIDENGNISDISKLVFDTECYSHIKNIIYLSSKYEREAYISELYAELTEFNNKHYYQILKDTNTYKAYQSFIKDVNFIKNPLYKNEIQYVLSTYNIDYNKFIVNAENNLKLFKYKLWKAVSLFVDNQEIYVEQ